MIYIYEKENYCLLFKWSHLRVSSTDSFRVSLYNIIQRHRKVLLSNYHFNGHT